MSHRGDITLGDTLDLCFSTVGTTGAPTQLAGSPVVSAYVGNSTTQITAGITLDVDFDGVTGLNHVRVVASGGNGYTTGTNVDLVITTGTVGGTSVVGYVVGSFSIGARSAFARLGAPAGASTAADIAAVKAQTAIIETDTAEIGAAGAGLTAVASAANLATVAGYLDTEIAAIKAKTDNLPAAPAAVGDIPTATQNADALLNRDMSAVSDTNARSPLNALRFLRNKWSVAAGTLTVTKENDSTSAWTATVTTDAAAEPIIGNDPA